MTPTLSYPKQAQHLAAQFSLPPALAAHERMREAVDRLNTMIIIAGKPTGRVARRDAC
jgi:hypothetical protein